MRSFATLTLLGCCALFLLRCDKEQLGLPRVALSVTSPDGRAVAFVRNHPSIDPPEQSVWLSVDGRARQLRRLGPDSDWCNTIVWSADGSTVGFLVQDARLLTFDRASGQFVSEKWLTKWQGEYPPHNVAVNLGLSADGREAIYRECGRRPGSLAGCTDRNMQIR
ncbi:MAG: hypothetical protein ACXW2P_08660 [Thermoanaerobaculia bacterium]